MQERFDRLAETHFFGAFVSIVFPSLLTFGTALGVCLLRIRRETRIIGRAEPA